MIFKQMLDPVSSNYTYILASAKGAEALIIDPVLEEVEEYLKFLGENNLRLVVAADTHVHADHKTGVGKLRDLTRCMTCMSEKAPTSKISRRLKEGDHISIEGFDLKVFETPGHTNDSICYYTQGMVFTGDTLFIRGNGRTDFQHGDAGELYDSLHEKLFKLPNDTVVWPGHDYKGEQCSTIGRERLENPRYAGKTREQFIEIMNNLDLPNPEMMDIVLPFNQTFGNDVDGRLSAERIVDCDELEAAKEAYIVDLREPEEIESHGTIYHSANIPLRTLEDSLDNPSHPINTSDEVIYFCAHGERSALAVELSLEKGHTNVKHLVGGFGAWEKSGKPSA